MSAFCPGVLTVAGEWTSGIAVGDIATVYIPGPAAIGGTATQAAPYGEYSLLVGSGASRFKGGLRLNLAHITSATTYTVNATTDFEMLADYTATGAVSVTLPAGSTTIDGAVFVVTDSGYNCDANTITVGRNGAKINNASSDYTITTKGASVWFTYDATAGNWIVS